ncbi:MAG: IS982 family transposase [Actinobacteria bacterium]|nr:IS982 family transposase [Actinomycetota bacterium]MCA1701427.1 IS982 family transposase [Actinomycetota bacterium]
MLADLDSLLIALYVLVDDLLPARSGAGRRPRITDAELITLAVAQILLQCHSERRFLRLASKQLSHLFPYIPKQPGYNKRLRALAPQICQVIEHLAKTSPSFCERLRLLDSTPVPCGASRETVKRSELAGWAAYGYCASHSRYFWGLRLYLLCAPDGMPISFCLAPANEPEREVAEAMLERARQAGLLTGGEVIVGDKGFAGQEFEQIVAAFDATLIRPDRKGERPRFGKLGRIRQWIESVYQTTKGQLSLELHGGHIPAGVWARVCQRVLALAAGVWHSWQLWQAGEIDAPGRHFTLYDH